MTDKLKLRRGCIYWWEDPDDSMCSKMVTVADVERESIVGVIALNTDEYFEVLPEELESVYYD